MYFLYFRRHLLLQNCLGDRENNNCEFKFFYSPLNLFYTKKRCLKVQRNYLPKPYMLNKCLFKCRPNCDKKIMSPIAGIRIIYNI